MKTQSFTSTALIFSILLSGCGIQNMNHPAKSESYHNMGNQGYHIKQGTNSTSIQSQSQSGSVSTYNMTRKTLDGSFDLYCSQQLEMKLNRAGITSYTVLASANMVILGLTYPEAEDRKNKQGTSTTPQLANSSNQINGIAVKDLETKNIGNQSINQISNQSNQLVVNPGLGRNSRIEQANSRNVYRAQEVLEREIGKNTEIIFIADPAGIDAVSNIRKKLSERGAPGQVSIQSELSTLENSINK
ncbi:MAG TPA: hypothetical protein VJ824_10940 [Bacillota bacterium]|nr:hypothetical protein [Bacillota bacterium]